MAEELFWSAAALKQRSGGANDQSGNVHAFDQEDVRGIYTKGPGASAVGVLHRRSSGEAVAQAILRSGSEAVAHK